MTEIPPYGGCPWPVDPACLTDEWATMSLAVQDRSVALASSTLARLTGYRVTNCPVTVRPCAMACASAYDLAVPYVSNFGRGWMQPYLNAGGNWVNCGGMAGCSTPCEVVLPAPIGRVDEVKVDGLVVDPANYRVDNGNRLVWQGTGCGFPATQNLSLPDTEVDTFSITYLNGYSVDSSGAYAAGVLAMEYARACTGKGKCRLPSGVTSIVRQGISMEITSAAFPNGRTGIREVDTYVALWNPDNKRQATSVWSPDMPTFRRTSQ